MKRKGPKGWRRRQQCEGLDTPGCERHLRSSGVAVLGADRCPSVHDKSLLSTAFFPLTTREKMEADQRSIYVGNVSGSPWHCLVPSWVCVPNPWCGAHLCPPKPGCSHPRCFSSAQPSLGVWLIVCHLQLTCCRCQLPKKTPGSCGLCGIACSFKTGQVVCWICVPGGSTQLGGSPDPQQGLSCAGGV